MEVRRLDVSSDSVSIRPKKQTVVGWYINRAKENLPAQVHSEGCFSLGYISCKSSKAHTSSDRSAISSHEVVVSI